MGDRDWSVVQWWKLRVLAASVRSFFGTSFGPCSSSSVFSVLLQIVPRSARPQSKSTVGFGVSSGVVASKSSIVSTIYFPSLLLPFEAIRGSICSLTYKFCSNLLAQAFFINIKSQFLLITIFLLASYGMQFLVKLLRWGQGSLICFENCWLSFEKWSPAGLVGKLWFLGASSVLYLSDFFSLSCNLSSLS